MKRFKVYCQGKHIDTVYYDDSCDEEYVKMSLINYDGYPTNIVIKGI